MILFVNAKINIGLSIVRRREDGYHDLESVFYPVGVLSGTPASPGPFNDILEITPADADALHLTGREFDCPLDKNLVWRALLAYRQALAERGLSDALPPVSVTLEKHLPDGAGLGGGSADASFTLRGLNEMAGKPLGDDELARVALTLGADCPFFIYNRPAFVSGIGERIDPIDLSLAGKWCVIVKPDLYVSTKEAFAHIQPRAPRLDLRQLGRLPLCEWRGNILTDFEDPVHNDFEDSLLPRHAVLRDFKEILHAYSPFYASMSGSGSALYALFDDEERAAECAHVFSQTDRAVWLLLLT